MSTNKEIAEAFKRAVPILARNESECSWLNWNEYICHSLELSTPLAGAMAARNVIHTRLNGPGSVVTWLLKQGIPAEDLTKDNVQAYRHRWLQELIREFSA